ncbi:hypothetical protein KVR01_012979 [Diaporthe batatas]|uniref:uncharacterized protein n=1 Tax=Diaporthe batatas TaxID=748121 RepID=UPI001D05B992|nr:uncharacterized protein KVR01_012979 [Diaporthe batatas]KAG8157271.1 hypothetical protein KVR01_012979 [Diaporthe batatas]
MGSPNETLKPDTPGTPARRSPSPMAPSPRAPENTDDASAAGKRTPDIAYRIKTPGQALHDAITRKDLNGVTRILRASPDIVDAKNERGRTALHVAAQLGHNEIVRLLVAKGAVVDARSWWKYTPLHFATEAARRDVVVTLLDAGADVHAATKDGLTPLHMAAAKEGGSSTDLLITLLTRGAYCNTMDNGASTPLQIAVAMGHPSNARVLCAFRADPHFKNKNGNDAFDYATRLGDLGGRGGEMARVMDEWKGCGKQTRNLKILPRLAKFITNEGRVDASEMLSWVSGNGYAMLVRFVLEHIAKDSPEIVDSRGSKTGWRPIHHAAWAGQSDVCEVLLAHGATVDAETVTSKWTPLHLAAWKGRQRTLRVLLDHGADILATAELTPPWRVEIDSESPILLTSVTSFWLAAGGRHPKSLDVLQEFALQIPNGKRHIAAMDDYTKARHHLATLLGQADDSHSGKSNNNSKGSEPQAQAVRSSPSPPSEVDVPGTSGSFDGALFSVSSTSSQLSHSPTYQILLKVWDNFDFKKGRDEPIKIAVLDTGLDVKHPNFLNPRLTGFEGGKPVWAKKPEPSQYERIKACADFTGDGLVESKDDMIDLNGHGTQVTELILRLAPRSDLYIARICTGEVGSGTHTPTNSTIKHPRPDIVARAIDWAIAQEVDIINMSFGFREINETLKAALIRATNSKILVFAAMSNDGNNSERAAWPARDQDRAIGVHSCDKYGKRASGFTPPSVDGSHNFMFVGEEVITLRPQAQGGEYGLNEGTSFASPAVAAMAALILGYALQHIFKQERMDAKNIYGVNLDDLRELGGMKKVLNRISKKDEARNYSYIHPKLLWNGISPKLEEDAGRVRQYAWDILVESLL